MRWSRSPRIIWIILLRDFEELTIAEIAERLSEEQDAIKSRLHRARELVREYMLGPSATTGQCATTG